MFCFVSFLHKGSPSWETNPFHRDRWGDFSQYKIICKKSSSSKQPDLYISTAFLYPQGSFLVGTLENQAGRLHFWGREAKMEAHLCRSRRTSLPGKNEVLSSSSCRGTFYLMPFSQLSGLCKAHFEQLNFVELSVLVNTGVFSFELLKEQACVLERPWVCPAL